MRRVGIVVFVLLIASACEQPWIELASRDIAGDGANASSADPALSADGRFVLFTSTSSNLVPGDDANDDLFRFDRDTASVVRANLPRATRIRGSLQPGGISADGRYATFSTTDGSLVAGDTNGASDVFLYDWDAGSVVLVSRAPTGAVGNGGSSAPRISGDGRRVVFTTQATNLSSVDNGPAQDVFLWDRMTGALTLMSLAVDGSPANGFSVLAEINQAGTLVTYSSAATNLTTAPDQNGKRDIYAYHVASRRTMRVSITPAGVEPDGECINGVPSDDWHVLLHCSASTLVPGDTNNVGDIYLVDLVSGQIERVNLRPGGVQSPEEPAFAPLSISSGGRLVAFASGDDALAGAGLDGTFVRNVATGQAIHGAPVAAEMSADGRYLTYSFDATPGALQVLLASTGQTADTLTADDDSDGLPTEWENRAGLNGTSATGDDGATGDPDGDGFISRDEYQQVVSRLGEGITDEQVTELFALADADDDKRITFDEFRASFG